MVECGVGGLVRGGNGRVCDEMLVTTTIESVMTLERLMVGNDGVLE